MTKKFLKVLYGGMLKLTPITNFSLRQAKWSSARISLSCCLFGGFAVKISYQIYVIGVIISFFIAYISMPAVMRLAKKIGAMDKPDPRKVHVRPMPRLGGLSIFLGFMAVVITTQTLSRPLTGIVLGAATIFIVGVLDDIYDLSPWTKLIGQIAAAGIAFYFGVRVQVMTNPFDGVVQLGQQISLPLTVLWIIGVTNAVNLIDGLDGLAGGVSAIAAVTIGIVAFRGDQFVIAFVALILAASIAGFLPYNFNPARTFMGDSGAMFLGFVLSCISVSGLAKSAALMSLFVPVVILGIPVFDTLFAIVRRVNNGTPIFGADKAHLHHRLLAMGFSQRKSVLIIYAISIILGGVAVTMTYVSNPKAMLIMAILILLLVLGAGWMGILSGKPQKKETTDQSTGTEIYNEGKHQAM